MPDNAYRPTSKLALTLMGLLAAIGILDALTFIFSFINAFAPYPVSVPDSDPVSLWLLLIASAGLIALPVSILTAIYFLLWQYRSYKNLTPLGTRDLQLSAGWTVVIWFLPIVNLFMPFFIMRKISDESSSGAYARAGLIGRTETQPPLGTWWALWILTNLTGGVAAFLDASDPNAKDLSGQILGLAAVSNFLSALAAIAAIMVVKNITERQKNRLENMVVSPSAFDQT